MMRCLCVKLNQLYQEMCRVLPSFASLISGGHMSDIMSAFVAEIAPAVVLSSLFALLTRTLLE